MKKIIKKDIIEEYVLTASMIKWVCLAVFIGLTVGGATALFIKIVNAGTVFTEKFKYYYLLMPLAFFLSCFIVKKLAPDAEGHGTEKAIEAYHKHAGKMDIKVVPVKILSTFITIIFGGSVGEEGPATQIGAGIASYFAGILKLNDTDRRRIVVCGIAAGFVGVFGSPVGAAVFASEVLYVGRFAYLVFFPSLIASFVSYFVGRNLGTKPLIMYFVDVKKIATSSIFIRMIVFGVFIGLLGLLFIRFVNKVEETFKGMNIYAPLKGVIGGLIILFLIWLTGSTDTIGIGEHVIERAVSGEKIGGFSFIGKMITSSVTLGSGGSGGILTPMLYIGATAGNVWAQITNGTPSFYAAIGMVAFLSTCANTPIAGMIMSMELFGSEVGMYASIVCAVSYLLVGHKSIYPTQILARCKTPSLTMDIEREISEVNDFKIKNKLLREIVYKKDESNNKNFFE